MRYNSNTKVRIGLAAWTSLVVTAWLFGVFWILINNDKGYRLSDTVLNVLLGTTTLNVLILSIIVLKGLFPQGGKDDDLTA